MKRRPLLWGALCGALLSLGLPRPRTDCLAPRLSIAGVPVGGLDRDACERALTRQAEAARVALQLGPGRNCVFTWAQLGLELDFPATWQAAYAVGHGPDAGTGELSWLRAELLPTTAPLCLRPSWGLARRQLAALAEATRTAPHPPAPSPERRGGATAQGPSSQIINVPASLAALQQALTRDFSPTLICPWRAVPATPTAEALTACPRVQATYAVTAPGDPARAANWRRALGLLGGTGLGPGQSANLSALLRAAEGAGQWRWAAAADGALARWAEGSQDAVAAYARVARQAGLTVRREPGPELWPGDGDLVLTNPTARRMLLCLAGSASRPVVQVRSGDGLAPPVPATAPTRTLTLAAVGDVLLQGLPPVTLPGALARADVSFANLESPVAWQGQPTPAKTPWDLATGHEFLFRAAPDTALPTLRGAVDVVSLANNHAGDYGPAATRETRALLAQGRVATCGSGENETAAVAPARGDCAGLRVAVVAFVEGSTLPAPHAFAAGDLRPGLAVLTTTPEGALTAASDDLLQTSLRAARATAEVVVFSCHWGRERSNTPTTAQRTLAHRAIDLGADVVLGHHPHRLQPLEMYRQRLICYSLGNFVFPGAQGAQARSALLRLRLTDEGMIAAGELLPYRLAGGRPRALPPGEAADRAAARRDLGV